MYPFFLYFLYLLPFKATGISVFLTSGGQATVLVRDRVDADVAQRVGMAQLETKSLKAAGA